MNYIKQLQADNKVLQDKLNAIEQEILNLEIYYTSSKFHGIEHNYAHVTTDLLPRLSNLKQLLT